MNAPIETTASYLNATITIRVAMPVDMNRAQLEVWRAAIDAYIKTNLDRLKTDIARSEIVSAS